MFHRSHRVSVFSGIALLTSMTSASYAAPNVLYDVTFDAPNVVGQPPVQGAGAFPRHTVSPTTDPFFTGGIVEANTSAPVGLQSVSLNLRQGAGSIGTLFRLDDAPGGPQPFYCFDFQVQNPTRKKYSELNFVVQSDVSLFGTALPVPHNSGIPTFIRITATRGIASYTNAMPSYQYVLNFYVDGNLGPVFGPATVSGSALQWIGLSKYEGYPYGMGVYIDNVRVSAGQCPGMPYIRYAPSATATKVVMQASHGLVRNLYGPGGYWSQAFDANSVAYELTSNAGERFTSDIPLRSPQLEYLVNFVQSGTYYVWVRGRSLDDASNSVHVGLNGGVVATSTYIDGLPRPNFGWVNKLNNGSRASVTISKPGLNAIDLWVREDGAQVEKLLLTTDANYAPGDSEVETTMQTVVTGTSAPR